MSQDTRPGPGPLRVYPKRVRVFRNPEEYCPQILQFLQDGPPFFTVAANRAGVPASTAKSWLYEGLDRWHEYLTPWAEQVQAIRAEYISRTLKELEQTEDKVRHNSLTWILARLDRENFDPPKQILQRVDVLPEAPAPAPAELQADYQTSLEKPEDEQA